MRVLAWRASIVILTIIGVTPARGQASRQAVPLPRALLPANATRPGDAWLLEAKGLYESGRGLRRGGIVLTLLGTAMIGVGGGLLAYELTRSCASSLPGIPCGNGRLAGFGGITAIAGIPTLLIGLPMWGIGSSQMNRATRMGYLPAGVRAILSPTQGGFMAGLEIVHF